MLGLSDPNCLRAARPSLQVLAGIKVETLTVDKASVKRQGKGAAIPRSNPGKVSWCVRMCVWVEGGVVWMVLGVHAMCQQFAWDTPQREVYRPYGQA